MPVSEFFKSIHIGHYRTNMDAQQVYIFFISSAAIQEQVIHFWLLFFLVRCIESCMNSRPAEYSPYRSFFPMDIDALTGGNQVIDATVPFQVQQSFRRNIINEPADLIGMGLYYHFKIFIGAYHAHRRTVRIRKLPVDKGF